MRKGHRPENAIFDRRSFCAAAGATALTALAPHPANADEAIEDNNPTQPELITGNGEWTYKVSTGWGRLSAGIVFGGTHGGIATDKAGHVYVSTQSATGILVYSPDGSLLKTIANQYPEVHSIVYVEEDGADYLYTTVQTGTPRENWLFVKMKTNGRVVQKITAPPEAGFKAPNEWRLTAAIPAPDGSIFIANGYGDSRLFRFDKDGNYRASYAGKGEMDGLFDCSHGVSVDMRYDQPLMLVCDRENRRLCHFDFDGKFVRSITHHLRRPCQTSFYGDCVVVSELEGRVTILDRDNAPVAFLGDNPKKAQWANYKLAPGDVAPSLFTAAHGIHIDSQSNIYVSDWNQTGRVTKLARIST